MEFDKNTPRKEAKIQGVVLNVIQPYAEGHVLTEKEAAVINQTLAENIRNNFASTVKKAVEAADDKPENVDAKALQKDLNEYMKGYEFGVRSGGGGGGRAMDPVEKKAMDIARAKVREAIKAKGYKVSDVPGAKITELARQLLEKTPAITEEAKRQIEAAREVAADSLGDLGDLLGGDEKDAKKAA